MPAKETALALLATFEPMDVAANIGLRTPDCTWHMAPASTGYSPAGQSNEQHEKHLRGIHAFVYRFPVTPIEVWEGKREEGGTVVTVWAKSEAFFRDEIKGDDPSVDWQFLNEYMFVIEVDETGEKVKRVVEMLDSKQVAGVQKLLALAKENLEKRLKGGA